MPSRMERYYKTDLPKQRSSLNKHLYDSIYEKGTYSNIEGVTTIDKNEIDLEQIRKLIKPEEKKERRRFDDSFTRPDHQISIEKEYDSSTYDIRDVLNRAKNEREQEEEKRYNLRNTQYDILKNLNLKEHDEKEELKELFNTITNNSKLNKMSEKETDILEGLKSTGTNIDESVSIKKVLEQKKEYIPSEETELDKSFFTSSFDFSKDDFEEMKDMNPKKGNVLIKILIFILSVAFVTGIIFVVYEFL